MTTGAKIGRPHLGKRHIVFVHVPGQARDALDQLKEAVGGDRGAVLADLACWQVGAPQLARFLTADHDWQSMVGSFVPSSDASEDADIPRVTTRLPYVVRDAIDAIVRETGVARARLLADLACCAVGMPELARYVTFDAQKYHRIPVHADNQEVLALAM